MVSSNLGISLSGPVPSTKSDLTLCSYNPVGGSGNQPTSSVEFQAGITPTAFSLERSQAAKNNKNVTSVKGIGDDGFSFTISASSSEYTVLYFLVASGSGSGIQVGISSPASLNAEESLARAILPLL